MARLLRETAKDLKFAFGSNISYEQVGFSELKKIFKNWEITKLSHHKSLG